MAFGEVYPVAAEPPWKPRRNLTTAIALPLAPVVMVGMIFLVHLIWQNLDFSSFSRDRSVTVAAGARPELAATADEVLRKRAVAFSSPISTGDEAWSTEPEPMAPVAANAAVDGDLETSGGASDSGPREDEASASAEDGERSSDGPELAVYEGELGQGNTIAKKLSRYGLDGGDVDEIVDAFQGLFDFRSARPEHSYRLEVRRSTGEVERFRYEASLTDIFVARRRGGRLKGRRVEVETDSRWIKVGGKIESSLAEAISKVGLRRRVLRAFLRTFGTDMSFQNDIRPNDTFRVIAEEERLDGKSIGYKAVWAIEYTGKIGGRRTAYYYVDPEGRGRYYDAKGRSFERNRLRNPVNYRRISSPFDLNRFHPVLKRRRPHRGVDFAASRGTPVRAAADGRVAFAARKGANGNLVILDHEGNLSSIYAHLQKFARGLKRGQEVDQGELIGYVGSTGRSTGPHLHYGLRVNKRFVDPMKYRAGPGRPIKRRYRGPYLRHSRKLARQLKQIRIR